MDCINLLAFIQIAVAFDFGLVYLSNTHIFTNILDSLLEEMKVSCARLIKKAHTVCEQDRGYKGLAVRAKRAELIEVINNLEFLLDPQNVRWDKYAYTGIYSGVYGLLCLLLIGLKECRIDEFIHNFLLISGEIILIYQFINLIQLSRISNKKISVVKILYKGVWLCGILGLSVIIALTGFYWKIFQSFNLPFVLITICIVYFPFFVYAYRILKVWYTIKSKISKCEALLKELENCIG
ncbi:MAG: hypothetical protein K2J78_11825 [Muribaculaceae bacterium]|nr:hypothetical protein [Muribaculaceae bacterium]